VKYGRKLNVTFTVSLLAVMPAGLYILDRSENSSRVPFPIERLANGTPVGTAPRLEREFKFSFAATTDHLLDPRFRQLQTEIFEALRRGLVAEDWKAPELLGKPYFIARHPMLLVTRDIYLETDSDLAFKHAISYRLRHRFKSARRLHRHETRPKNPAYFPYRGEIQAKVDRKEDGGGFSRVTEARLEFREQSPPYSALRKPPPAPWLPRDFLPVAKSGEFEGSATAPARTLARYLLRLGYKGVIHWRVGLVLISTRMRMHLNIKTRYGSGPNPDQVYIISIDRTDVADGREYMNFLKRSWYEGANVVRPRIRKTFFEIEVEFERNVSTRLDEAVRVAGNGFEKTLRRGFAADQITIKRLIIQRLKELGLRPGEQDRSKYQQAYLPPDRV
jgi:hypothetical protein